MRTCPGIEGRHCGRFLSNLEVDAHSLCPRCRGNDCTPDNVCQECSCWSDSQWKAYISRRSFKKRRSGSERSVSSSSSSDLSRQTSSSSQKSKKTQPCPLPVNVSTNDHLTARAVVTACQSAVTKPVPVVQPRSVRLPVVMPRPVGVTSTAVTRPVLPARYLPAARPAMTRTTSCPITDGRSFVYQRAPVAQPVYTQSTIADNSNLEDQLCISQPDWSITGMLEQHTTQQTTSGFTCPVQRAEEQQLLNALPLTDLMPPPNRPLPQLHLIPGKDTPFTSLRKEVNLKLQESREEQSRQMAALLQITQNLVSSVTGNRPPLLQPVPAAIPSIDSSQTTVNEPVMESRPGASVEIPFPIPGISYSAISRSTPAIDVTSQTSAPALTTASISVQSSKSETLQSSLISTAPFAGGLTLSPTAHSSIVGACSLPSYQIPKLTSVEESQPVETDPGQTTDPMDMDAVQLYVEVDELEDGEFRVVTPDKQTVEEDSADRKDSRHSRSRRRSHDSTDRHTHRDRSSHRHKRSRHDEDRESSHSRHRSRDRHSHRDRSRDRHSSRSHRSRHSEERSSRRSEERDSTIPSVVQGDRRILQVIHPAPETVQALDEQSETSTDPKYLDVLSWINQQFPETIQEQSSTQAHGSLAESLYEQQPRTSFPSLPWSHGCIDAINRANNILTGALPNKVAAPLKIGKLLPNFDLNYKYYQVRDVPSITTATLNPSVEQMVPSNQRDSLRKPKVEVSLEELKSFELIFRRSRVVTSALDWQLAAAVKLLQTQCQETPSPLFHQTLRLLLSAAKSITQLQLEQTVGLTNTLLKRRDAVVQKLPRQLSDQDKVALRASSVDSPQLFDELIVGSANQHLEASIQREANLKVASQISKPPKKNNQKPSTSNDNQRDDRFSTRSQSGAAGSGTTRTVTFGGTKGKPGKYQTPKGRRH